MAIGSVAIAFALMLAGCAADHRAVAAGSTPTPAVSASAAMSVTDAETCEGIGDVVSITFNADVGMSQGRMSVQEQQSWYRLAVRVLGRVPTRGEGSVSEAVADLQAAAPSVPSASAGGAQIGSDEWDSARRVVFESCEAAGAEIWTSAFTGG